MLQLAPGCCFLQAELVALGPWLRQVLAELADNARIFLREGRQQFEHPREPPIPECPPGWSLRMVLLGHCEVGGATLGQWTIVTWYLPSTPFSEPLPVIPQPWFPQFHYVKDRERADPHASPPVSGTSVPLVVQIEGLVQDWGLFPASDLVAKVLVQCSSSPSGHRLCLLTWLELGRLRDLPISIMDTLPTVGGDALLRFFARAPRPRSWHWGQIFC